MKKILTVQQNNNGTMYIYIPLKIVKELELKKGELVEFSTEGKYKMILKRSKKINETV